ncbi:redoxin domain-containing protein, partial [bacterium]
VWATTCGPCIKKLKHYNDKTPKAKDTELIIISTDSNFEKWKKFQEINKLHYESYISKDKAITNIFQIDMLPFSIYLENGIVKEIEPELSNYFDN